MEKYLGVKIVEAEPQQREKWMNNKWEDRDDHSLVDGYKVVYEDGYISWSPKDVFEKAYRRIDNLTFGLAVEALKQGKKVSRAGWNGKGMFIFIRPADELEVGFIIDKVKSLPQSVKDFFKTKDEKEAPSEQGLSKVKFGPYLCMYAADGSIVNGWLASQTDILAEDWKII